VLFPEFINNQIPLTCVKQCFGMPGAQHAMASMLAVVSRLNDYWWLRSHSKLEWRLPYELQGRTLGILGFGNIGRTLAQLAKPFGIRILAMARTPHADPAPADQLLLPHELPLLLGESDFVVVAVPLTDQTRGMIDEPQLRLMKRSAWFIDISGRPAIVNQEAVIRALEHQWIGGADLQFATAPPPFSSLWTMENLIMSQYSANSQEESRRCNELFAENLRRFQKGEPLMGLVDKKAGY
jgi:phosphoglycerate dehydrogenase-like enzyme